MPDHLRRYWDWDDLDGTESRFRELLESESRATAQAEVLTQLARVCGLRRDFDAGARLLEQARGLAGDEPTAWTRIDLESGRLRRSAGDPEAAFPLFESAFDRAIEAGELFLAGDAAHMAALAAPDFATSDEWTQRGIVLGETEAAARYWLGPLLNNVGWAHHEAGRYEAALAAFEPALVERQRDPENAEAIELAQYAVAKTLRALDRPKEALAHVTAAARSAESRGAPDSWFHEELAETCLALGQHEKAARDAQRALELLTEGDSSFDPDCERGLRLRDLAASRG